MDRGAASGSGPGRAGSSAGLAAQPPLQSFSAFKAYCITVIATATRHLCETEPEIDLTPYRMLRLYLENCHDGVPADDLPRIQSIIIGLQTDPKALLHAYPEYEFYQQRQGQAQRLDQGYGVVSGDTRPGPSAPIRLQQPVMNRAVAPPGSGSDRAGGSAGITAESSPQTFREFTAQCIRVVDNAMGILRTMVPEVDLRVYRMIRSYLENSRDGMPAGILAKMQNIIRGLVADPKALLQARPEYQLHQQWQGQPQRPDQGNRAVSTGTPQGPFAQIRVPMGAPGQRMMGAVQPDQGNRAVSTGTPQGPFAQIRVPMGAPGQRMMGAVQPGMASGLRLEHRLTQDAERPTAPRQRRQPQRQRQMQTDGRPRLPWMSPDEETHGQQMLQQDQQQQQQPQLQPAHQLSERPVTKFSAAMDKIAEDFIQLEREYGTESFNKARCEISDETYALRRSIGCTLPRDIVHPPTGLDPSSSSSTSQNRKRVSDDNRESPNHAGLAKRTKDGMDADGPDEAGYEKAELPNEHKLFSGDKSPASKDFTLDDVNPKLREEVKRTIERLHEVTFTLVHPGEDDGVPNMAEMETHVTCLDLNEWKNSIIFKLVFNHKTLPWDLPPLFIRIPPNYLVEQRVNWYTRMDEFNNPNIPNDGKINTFIRDDIHTFLKLCSTQVSHYMDNLRTVSAAERLGVKINFSYIAEVWTRSLFMGLKQFMAS